MSDAQGPDPALAPAPSEAPGAPQWEFEPQHERLIADLAAKMQFVGFFALLVGGLGAALMVVSWFRSQIVLIDVSSLILMFLGLWTLSASREFAGVAATQGRDISHLMRALGTLRTMYRLFYWLLLIGLVLVLILGVLRTAGGGAGAVG